MSRKLPTSPAGFASGDGDQWQTLKSLLPYLWPEGRMDLKVRVVLAMIALVASKIITVLTPYSFKYATDCPDRHGKCRGHCLQRYLLSWSWPMAWAAS